MPVQTQSISAKIIRRNQKKLLQEPIPLKAFTTEEWYNSRDVLPNCTGPFLIIVNGIYYKAVYNRKKMLFRADEELRETVFRVKEQTVLWKYLTHNN
jgi:hypothetical protein